MKPNSFVNIIKLALNGQICKEICNAEWTKWYCLGCFRFTFLFYNLIISEYPEHKLHRKWCRQRRNRQVRPRCQLHVFRGWYECQRNGVLHKRFQLHEDMVTTWTRLKIGNYMYSVGVFKTLCDCCFLEKKVHCSLRFPAAEIDSTCSLSPWSCWVAAWWHYCQLRIMWRMKVMESVFVEGFCVLM